MTRLFFATVFCILFAVTSFTFAQTTPTPTPTPEEENEEIIRISSELVLIDALVLDKKGNQIKDLNPEDFEVYQDGKLQDITNFSYVDGKNSTATVQKNKKDKKAIPPPPISIRSNQGRLITFVIDDGNCASPQGLALARDGVKKFIEKKMLPSDKIAIYRTRGGSNLLQMYTSNKEVLKREVNRARWYPNACGSVFEAARNTSTMNLTGEGASTFENETTKEFKENIASEQRDNLVRGTFGVLQFVIDRLKILPQRKIVFLVSNGFSVTPQNLSILREVTDKANRSSVVFYTMNQNGLTNPGFIGAEDNVSASDTENLGNARINEERVLAEGLGYLADQTGGEYIRNKNFLEGSMEKVLEKETGYYLLGYQPDADTFKGKKFHKIEVKLKRDDLKISSRRGFYGVEDKDSRPRYKNSKSPLYQAIASPFEENGIDLRLTTLTGNDAKTGDYIRAIFHINGEDLTFTDEPNGMKKILLDVVAVTLDEKGKVIEEFNYTYPIRIPQRGVEIVKQNGLDYLTDIPIKNNGYYSFRLAIRDVNSKRLGSAGDFVEIPKPNKKNFYISSLLTTNFTNEGKPMVPTKRATNAAFAPVFSTTIPSIRQYKAGSRFAYIYKIYNAKTDSKTRKPNLTTQFRLYKDGTLITESNEIPVELEQQKDILRIQGQGALSLDEDAEIGEYILQLITKDKVANKTSTQWIDFELIQ